MRKENYDRRKLVRLIDSTLTFANSADDIRGRKVMDQNLREIGTINGLYIDEVEGRVRFLRVVSGGIFGLGETKFLIPVETINKVTDDQVNINIKDSHLTEAPTYNPDFVEGKYLEELYGFYGFIPFWVPVDL